MEQLHFNGENLARYGDVVVVTINHRLNILGYMDVSSIGEEYSNSGNVGNADIVAALKWVRDNISGFGGDPGNVTVFGQSGGGAKIQNIMHAPSADGLYHRAIIQSGVFGGESMLSPLRGDGRRLLECLTDRLSLNDPCEITGVSYHDLSGAYDSVVPQLRDEGEYTGGSPIINDWMTERFTDYAKSVPVMVGSVFAEFTVKRAVVGKEHLSREQVYEILRENLGDRTDELISLFSEAYPEKNPVDLIAMDTYMRAAVIEFVRYYSSVSSSGVYSYLFNYESPYLGGYPAEHNAELPFVFRNTDIVPMYNEPSVTKKLESQVSDAWIRFAKTGNPGWEGVSAGRIPTMVFDRECGVRVDFDEKLIKALGEALPMPFPAMRSKKD